MTRQKPPASSMTGCWSFTLIEPIPVPFGVLQQLPRPGHKGAHTSDLILDRHKRLRTNRRHPQRDSGFQDVANVHRRAKHSRHHTKHKQRLVVSVVAYDSFPGHQVTIFRDVLRPFMMQLRVRERNVVRQLIDRSTLRWWSLVTWRGSFRRMGGYGTAAVGAKRSFIRKQRLLM